MAALLTATGKQKLLDTGKTAFTHIGLVTDLSGTEPAGGGYARQALTFSAANASGFVQNSSTHSITVASGTTVIGIGLWDALTVGNLCAIAAIGSAAQLYGAGTLVASTGTVTDNAHGLATDDRIAFSSVSGQTLPTTFSATTLYFVRATGLTANTFTVATTSGGAAVTGAGDGEVTYIRTTPTTVTGVTPTFTIAAAAFTLDLRAFG